MNNPFDYKTDKHFHNMFDSMVKLQTEINRREAAAASMSGGFSQFIPLEKPSVKLDCDLLGANAKHVIHSVSELKHLYGNNPDTLKSHVQKEHEAALKHCLEIAENNAPKMAANLTTKENIIKMMAHVGIPSEYTTVETTRGGKSKSIVVKAGYLSDLERVCPTCTTSKMVSYLNSSLPKKMAEIADMVTATRARNTDLHGRATMKYNVPHLPAINAMNNYGGDLAASFDTVLSYGPAFSTPVTMDDFWSVCQSSGLQALVMAANGDCCKRVFTTSEIAEMFRDDPTLGRCWYINSIKSSKKTDLQQCFSKLIPRLKEDVATIQAKIDQFHEGVASANHRTEFYRLRELLVDKIQPYKREYIIGFDNISEGMEQWESIVSLILSGHVIEADLPKYGIILE